MATIVINLFINFFHVTEHREVVFDLRYELIPILHGVAHHHNRSQEWTSGECENRWKQLTLYQCLSIV